MGNLKIGDIVARKSYGFDMLFRITDICSPREGGEDVVTMKGICCRIAADAPVSDLVLQPKQAIMEYRKNSYMAVGR